MNKPRCKLVGENGNIFNLVAIASRVLKDAGLRKEAKDMQDRVFASHSYDEALVIICEYVEDGNPDDEDNENEFELEEE